MLPRGSIRIVPALAALLLVPGLLFPTGTAAASRRVARSACAPHRSCDPALGFSLIPARGWFPLPAGKEPPCSRTYVKGPISGLGWHVRLAVRTVDTTQGQSAAVAAARVSARLVLAELRANRHLHIHMARTTLAGAPGEMLTGLPGNGPTVMWVLASHGLVYELLAPGARLQPDQRAALASLRFTAHTGHLVICP